MSLPEFNNQGDLPPGVHQATLAQVVARFGTGSLQRQAVTTRLNNIYQLAQATGKLERFIIFGSYVSNKPAPNDVDIILVMSNDFKVTSYDENVRQLFDHEKAQRQLGASVFWTRPNMVLLESVDQFIAHWQIKRDKTQRGIVEVKQ